MKSELPCAVCDGTDVDIVGTHDRHGNPLRNVLCQGCGLVWVDPRPSDAEIDQFYAEDYRASYKGAVEPKMKHCYREMLRANQRVARLGQFYKSGDRLLDIGAGAGFFAYVLEGNDVDYQGIEPNQGYATFAREQLGLTSIDIGYLENIEDWETFDILTINHVFEHLHNPNQSLAHMHRLLKPGGHIIMEVPNAEADYHAPHKVFHLGHLYWYNPDALSALAAKHNFNVVDITLIPGTRHINIVMQKPNGERKAAPASQLHPTYQRLHSFFEGRSKLKHYLSPKPYRRFAGKMATYLQEYRYIKRFDDKLALIRSIPLQRL